MSEDSAARERAHQLTFVVHGIGEPQNADREVDAATSAFAQTWARRQGVLLRRSHDVAHEPQRSIEYAAYDGRLADGRRHRVVELQWADLSRAPSGLLAPLRACFRVILGLRDMALAAAHSRGGSDRLVRLAFGLLEGPILAFNIAMAVTFVLVIVERALAGGRYPREVIITAGIVVFVGYSIAGRLMRNPRQGNLLLSSLTWGRLVGVLTALLWPLARWAPWLMATDQAQRSPFFVCCFTLGSWLLLLWVPLIAVMTWLSLSWLVQLGAQRTGASRSLEAVNGAAQLALLAWLIAIPMTWAILLQAFEPLAPAATASAASASAPGVTQDEDATIAVALETGTSLLDRAQLETMQKAFVPTLGLHFLFVSSLACAVGLTLWRFRRETGRTRTSPPRPDARLIIGSPLRWVLGLAGPVSVGLAAVAVSHAGDIRLSDGSSPHVLGLGEQNGWLALVMKIGWLVTVLLAALAVAFRQQLRSAFDFVLDVTNYFHDGTAAEPVPAQVMARLGAIVAAELRSQHPERMLFVSHSQGSVYATDLLRGARHGSDTRPETGSSLREAELVTLGSPITHLYQHYFGGVYWNDEAGQPTVGRHMTSWHNAYRDSDYVGRTVDLEGVVNKRLGPGSHGGYFDDERLHAWLEELGLTPR